MSMLSAAAAQRAQGTRRWRERIATEKTDYRTGPISKSRSTISRQPRCKLLIDFSPRPDRVDRRDRKKHGTPSAGSPTQVIEGMIQMAIQQGIAHALGIGQTQAGHCRAERRERAGHRQRRTWAATQAAATFGANATGVGLVLSPPSLAAIGVLAGYAARAARQGAIYDGASRDGSDRPPPAVIA